MGDAQESAVGEALANEFYRAVPRDFETFCPVASRIALEVFRRFDIAANLVPCQLWHASPGGHHVMGFVGRAPEGRWDGHVVCMTQNLLFDGAIRGIQRDFGLDVPAVALTRRLTTPSQIIARSRAVGENRLWWLNPPNGFDTTPPLQPIKLIDDLATALAARVRKALAVRSAPTKSAA